MKEIDAFRLSGYLFHLEEARQYKLKKKLSLIQRTQEGKGEFLSNQLTM